jgi:diguanylate cyclase (GGDEF)-like protein/PAS domain S-box-containing protein
MSKSTPKATGKGNVKASGNTQGALQDLIFCVDPDGHVLNYNQAFLMVFGDQLATNLKEKSGQLFEGSEGASLNSLLKKALKNKQTCSQELIHHLLDRKFQVTVTPLTKSDGEVDCCICIAQDLHQIEIAEKIKSDQLQASLKSLVEHIDDRIWAVDKKYRLIYANPIMQKSIAKRIGRQLNPGESMLWEDMDENLVAHWKASYDRALVGDTFSVEANTLFATEPVYVTCQFKPIVSDDGQVTGVMIHGRDITKHVNAEEILRESEAKYRQLFEAESDSIFLIENETGKILEANSAAEKLYGYTREELLSKKNSDLSSEPDQTLEVTRSSAIDEDRIVKIPSRFHRKKDGTVFPVEITGRFFQWRGRSVHIAAIRDITERKQAQEAMMGIQIQMRQKMKEIESLQEKLQELAIRDPLTNLYNRRYMEESLSREISQANREAHSIGIIMIDIDNFKDFNDTYGHQNGDMALEIIGTLLNENIRSGDISCRYGGEEFVVILPQASLDNTIKRGKQIKHNFETMPLPVGSEQPAFLTISLGISNFPQHGIDRDTILNNADLALYKAKRLGKNRVVAYEEGNGKLIE